MSSVIVNPQDKMLNIYIENLQKSVDSLCKIINTLVSDDQIVFDAYENVKQILGEIKYFEKFNNKPNPVISVINTHSQHLPTLPITRQDYLPPIKLNQSTINSRNLSTIAQKQSEQNLLQNYIKKQSHKKPISKYLKTNQGNSKTINEPMGYLNTSRQFQIIREETRRSLDNQGLGEKKPFYKELEKFKGTEQIFPAVKDYLDKHNHKKYVTSRNPQYTITKFL